MNELRKAQRLRDKNVVIIGGSRGLGKTIVAATHAEGARVLAVARREQSLRQLAAEIPGVRDALARYAGRLRGRFTSYGATGGTELGAVLAQLEQ